MIIKQHESNIETFGDIQEHKISIDPKNIEFITTLLSSNLYSNPEASFLREIVSNAWDSQVEANNTDTPVLISISDNSITIRDFGTGLSPERFKNIYCNIGSSTKKDSNEYIGGFGIGRFSALACSNIVHITSYYNGVMYQYIMIKDVNTISTNLINTTPTIEKNGVEVTIQNIKESNIPIYIDALEQLVYFPNVYVNYTGTSHTKQILAERFNKSRIKHYSTFAISTYRSGVNLLLGNVVYPIDKKILSSTNHRFSYELCSISVNIKFDVGELDITPNRENIIYTQATIKKINDKFDAARLEIKKLIKDNVVTNCTDFRQFFDSFAQYLWFDLFNLKLDGGDTEEHVRINISNQSLLYSNLQLNLNYTYKGRTFNKHELEFLRNIIWYQNYPNIKWFIENDRIYSINNKRYTRAIEFKRGDLIIVENKNRLTTYAKNWLKDNFSNVAILGTTTKTIVRDCLINRIPITDRNNNTISNEFIDFIAEEYCNWINSHTKINFDTNEEYKKYEASEKEAAKANKTANKISVDTGKTIIYINEKYCRIKREYSSIKLAVNYIAHCKKGVVLDYIGEDNNENGEMCRIRNFVLITAKKSVVDYIFSLKLPNVVDISYFYRKDRQLAKINTIIKYRDDLMINEYIYTRVLPLIPKQYKTEIRKILALKRMLSSTYLDKISKTQQNPVINKYWEFLIKKLFDYKKAYSSICGTEGLPSYCNTESLSLFYYIFKQKSHLLIDLDEYKSQLTKTTLTQHLLCKT